MRAVLLLGLAACAHKNPPSSVGADGGAVAVCDPRGWPEATRAPMLAAQARGLELAARDRYAWEGSDRMVEALRAQTLEDLQRSRISGYVIDARGDAPVVHFLGMDGPTITPVLDVRFDGDHPQGLAVPLAGASPLDPESEEAREFRAIKTATADPGFVLEAPNYNPDVLPWSTDPAEGWAVYLIPGAADEDAVPLGGGYRAHVSADGNTILEMLPLSRTVMSVPVTTLHQSEGAMFITTVLTPLPDATYIAFANIWTIQLVVSTQDNGVWIVSGDRLCWTELSDTAR